MKHIPTWIPIQTFCDSNLFNENKKVDIKYLRSLGNGKHPLIKTIDKKIYIDTKGLARRREFKQKIWLESHNNYYEFMTSFKTEGAFAQFLSKHSEFTFNSWVMFLNVDLFAEQNFGIFKYKVPARLWRFYRITKLILKYRDKRIKRLEKIRDVKQLS